MMPTPAPRSGHPYHMHDAIYAQPGALRLVTRGNDAALDGAAARLSAAEHVALAGIGSSWHAALVGQALLAHVGRLGRRTRAYNAFDLCAYGPALDANSVAIVVSHSGEGRYARETLERAKAAGAGAIVVTGKDHDRLAHADHTLRTVPAEVSATHTVSYTTALALLAALAVRIGGDEDLAHALGEVPDHVATLLGQESWDDLAARHVGRPRFWFVGGGPNVATAYEAAMKVQEAAALTARAFDVEQFLHGSWAGLTAGDLLVAIAPAGPSRDRVAMAARAAREIGAPVLALVAEDDGELAALAAETIALPAVPEALSPLLAVVPLQLFTYHMAVARGVNPDTMRTDETAYARARAALAL